MCCLNWIFLGDSFGERTREFAFGNNTRFMIHLAYNFWTFSSHLNPVLWRESLLCKQGQIDETVARCRKCLCIFGATLYRNKLCHYRRYCIRNIIWPAFANFQSLLFSTIFSPYLLVSLHFGSYSAVLSLQNLLQSACRELHGLIQDCTQVCYNAIQNHISNTFAIIMWN